MLPDHEARLEDPRHGTVAGYNRIPCRERCCKDAMAKYKSLRELDLMAGRPRIVPAIGARRRVQALACLGWSNAEVARRAGMHPEHLPNLVNNAETITRRTAERIAKVYDELSMRFPPARTKQEKQAITYARNIARLKGWFPPLAWDEDNIDDPNYRPARDRRGEFPPDTIDPVVVERLLAGERVRSTRAEKDEALRRWKAMGRSERSLCEVHGWKEGRYGRSEVADAC